MKYARACEVLKIFIKLRFTMHRESDGRNTILSMQGCINDSINNNEAKPAQFYCEKI